jgi:ABC-type lipopolysaccharide export system ATPase subunit
VTWIEIREIGGNAYAQKRYFHELVRELCVKAQEKGEGTKLGDGRKRRVTLA